MYQNQLNKISSNLPNAIKKLKENRRTVPGHGGAIVAVVKSMAEIEPFLLN